MGRKEAPRSRGLPTLGIGMITACFQIAGMSADRKEQGVEVGQILDAPRSQMLDVEHRETVGAGCYGVAASLDCLQHHAGGETSGVVVEMMFPHDPALERACSSISGVDSVCKHCCKHCW